MNVKSLGRAEAVESTLYPFFQLVRTGELSRMAVRTLLLHDFL
eukprot:CAMPEP_0118989426 /NCGR_PEP_ID=MMETSP1173-20130426/47994_1 /TAXON_ID=1034831 /ORGANISM="Rhizochromulina marina cf, Strain CCMP1243" /LENGTH=42 /DNA_ID= /DNA_START= /DNA_END= /DNA_ORIENTATION=